MIASAIAYGLTGLFLLFGIVGIVNFANDKVKKENEFAHICVVISCLFIAYGCARLGGI